MQKNTWISVIIVAIVIVAVILAITLTHRPVATPAIDGTRATSADANGNPVTVGGGAQAPAGGPTGSNIIKSTPNEQVNYQSDLVTFSIAPGSQILNEIAATGIIDSSYTSNGTINVELADQNYDTEKTIVGSVTGNAKDGNVNFSANITTTGVKKGPGYIIFRQVSGTHYVRVAVIFD